MSPNVLIEASAGTGKTQALAARLIELLRGGVKPQEIVALTFSRAAAGEIFERFVTLLAAGAEKNPDDAKLLREVIATQHLSQIGTLDSFLMRIVRAFPLELGIGGKLEMMILWGTVPVQSPLIQTIRNLAIAALFVFPGLSGFPQEVQQDETPLMGL